MKLRHLALFLSLAACLAFAVSSATAGKVTPKISLNQVMNGALVTQSGPSLGSSVTFTTVIPTNVKIPRVEVLCYQNGALVYGEGGSPTDAFLLGGGGSLWLSGGGAASCVANLYYFTWNANTPGTTYLATTSFDAAG
jgi:hypothetical protein